RYYLHYCVLNGESVTVDTVREFMSDALRRNLVSDERRWRDALNWYFREGRRFCRTGKLNVPTPCSLRSQIEERSCSGSVREGIRLPSDAESRRCLHDGC